VNKARLRVGVLATHPVQYYVPWYREMSKAIDVSVFYCQRQTPDAQGGAGFGVSFDWDIPLLDGYNWRFLVNHSSRPNVSEFFGCDTPDIAAIIRRERFDAFVVHGWAVKSFWQAILACRRTGTPVLVRGDSQLPRVRSSLWRALKYPLYRSFIPRFDAYLVVGDRARGYLLHYGAEPDRMFFSPHAVDNDFFSRNADSFRPRQKLLRRFWHIPDEATVFLFAAKFIEKKRPWDFARAIAAAKVRSGVWGLMVGDGPMRKQIEEEAQQNGWPIRFAGFLNQTEMPKAYAASDALVLPSNGEETWGLVVNEAMASNLPAIVSDQVGCAPDLVRPGETGELFPCGSVSELTAILIHLTDRRVHLAELGAKARARVGEYSLARAAAGLETAVRSVAVTTR